MVVFYCLMHWIFRTSELVDDIEDVIDEVPLEPTGDEWDEETRAILDSDDDEINEP